VSLDQWQRDAFQVVVSEIFGLPVKKSTTGYLAELPEPTTSIPREKPVPKPKADSKWEKFRKSKGIPKKKKNTKIWDDRTQSWKFQHGFKRPENDGLLDWVIEDNPNKLREAGAEDPFIMERNEKKIRVTKQKGRERSNQYRVMNKDDRKQVPGIIGINNRGRHEKTDVERAIQFAQKSTASLGNFDHKFDDEPKIKRKEKRTSVTGNAKAEKKANMKIVNSIIKRKQGDLNMNVAVNQSIAEEQKKKKRRTK
jgi:regulator of ribosome biosynthesis